MRYAVLAITTFACTFSTSSAATEKFSGSGYAAVEGAVINYTYNNFGGFYLTVENHTLRWEGFHGYFYGLVSATPPQISEVAPGIFLYSWRTRGTGSDNVVHNYKTMRVTAHLQPDDGRGDAIQMIHGVVHGQNTPTCNRPSDKLTPRADFGPRLMQNAKEFGLPPMFDPALNNTPRAQADIVARQELAGQAIVYTAPEGTYRIEVDGDTTRVSIDSGPAEPFQTYASKLAEDLYFISWMGGVGGSHVVINATTRKVYDHILPSGERRESIFELDCFDAADSC